MNRIVVHEEFGVDRITQEKVWKSILDRASDFNGEEVEIDFYGVTLIDPCSKINFHELLKNKNVHMSFKGFNKSEIDKLSGTIELMCIMEGIDMRNRFRFEVVASKEEISREELDLIDRGTFLAEKFTYDKDVATLTLYKVYEILGNAKTVNYIMYAIDKIHSENGVSNFVLDLGNMKVDVTPMKFLGEGRVDLKKKGISLDIRSEFERYLDTIALYSNAVESTKYTTNDKIRKFMELPKNFAGLLSKYLQTRAIDPFGRMGKGEVISTRIAIFRGFARKNNSVSNRERVIVDISFDENGNLIDENGRRLNVKDVYVVIEEFTNDSFETRSEKIAVMDGEIEDGIKSFIRSIPVDDIGLCDYFLGRSYYFMPPIQRTKEESTTIIVGFNEKGTPCRENVTLPERIKIVASDWGISVDEESLNEAIEETKQLLGYDTVEK